MFVQSLAFGLPKTFGAVVVAAAVAGGGSVEPAGRQAGVENWRNWMVVELGES